jgi:TnpA family transposase
LRDSLVLLSIALEQETELEPTEIMTDTGACTDVIFGIFWLLGYQFRPRIADIGGARFWRIDPKADYGPLNNFASHKVRMGLIAQYWDDLLRLAGSLKLGLVQAGGLMRTLQTHDRPTPLARALEELGRIIKTPYMLRYIDDEAYRRRILTQLNRGEGRHELARIIFTASGASSGSATAKARKISSVRSGWSSMPSFCGTLFIWMRRSPNCGPKGSTSATKTSPGYRRSGMGI